MVVLTRGVIEAACLEIGGRDAVMAGLIARLPPAKLSRRQTPFHVLATSIINQQLSQKAAAAIEKRLALLVPPPFAPEVVLTMTVPQLRAAGLSASKAEYLHALARAAIEGTLAEATLRRQSDEEVIHSLTQIRGVGKWTAEMFLMFGLRRPDVLSLGDAGLLRAARRLYGKRFKGDDAAVLTKAAEKWRPWRSVGCYYLWRSLDG